MIMRHTGIASVNDASAVKPDGSLLHLTSTSTEPQTEYDVSPASHLLELLRDLKRTTDGADSPSAYFLPVEPLMIPSGEHYSARSAICTSRASQKLLLLSMAPSINRHNLSKKSVARSSNGIRKQSQHLASAWEVR